MKNHRKCSFIKEISFDIQYYYFITDIMKVVHRLFREISYNSEQFPFVQSSNVFNFSSLCSNLKNKLKLKMRMIEKRNALHPILNAPFSRSEIISRFTGTGFNALINETFENSLNKLWKLKMLILYVKDSVMRRPSRQFMRVFIREHEIYSHSIKYLANWFSTTFNGYFKYLIDVNLRNAYLNYCCGSWIDARHKKIIWITFVRWFVIPMPHWSYRSSGCIIIHISIV